MTSAFALALAWPLKVGARKTTDGGAAGRDGVDVLMIVGLISVDDFADADADADTENFFLVHVGILMGVRGLKMHGGGAHGVSVVMSLAHGWLILTHGAGAHARVTTLYPKDLKCATYSGVIRWN